MSLRELIIKEYQATITNSPSIPRELKKALAVNERVPGFINKLQIELDVPAFKDHSNNDMRKIVHDSTMFFVQLIAQRAHEKMMSEAEKSRIRSDIADKEIINKAVDTGIINEEVVDVLKRKDTKTSS